MHGNTLLIALRLVHVLSGLFWAGAGVLLAWFLLPVAQTAGVAGGQVVRRVMFERKLSMWLGIAMGLALLSGFTLYGRASVATAGAFARSTSGMIFGLGGLAAVFAGVAGGAFGGRIRRRLMALGQAVQASGGQPDAKVAAEMSVLQKRAAMWSHITAWLLVIATAAMATARYT